MVNPAKSYIRPAVTCPAGNQRIANARNCRIWKTSIEVGAIWGLPAPVADPRGKPVADPGGPGVKGKTPILNKFWAQPPLGVKIPLAPLTKILDPRLQTLGF